MWREDLQNLNPGSADKVVLLAGPPSSIDYSLIWKVVLLAGPPSSKNDLRLADSAALVVNSTIEAIFLDAKVDRFCIFEYIYAENAQILPPVPRCSKLLSEDGTESEAGVAPERDPGGTNSIASARFAAGRILTPAMIGALFAQA